MECPLLIGGTLWIQLPTRVAVQVVSLQSETIPQEQRREHHFLRITEFKETENGWRLSYEFGHCSLEREELRLDYGHVDVLNESGSVMRGHVKSAGRGGGWQSSTNESSQTFQIEYPTRPASVRWTYVTHTKEHRIPVRFVDCRVPDVLWRQKPEEEDAQQTGPRDGVPTAHDP
jgi:hypothetical protein